MKNSKEDPFLRDLFGGQDLQALRRSSLEASLAGLKRKRLRNRIGRAALLIPALLALVLVLRPVQDKQVSTKPTGNLVAASPLHPSTKIISERELFALFPNRPMALVGKPGHQQVVFLDEAPSRN